jgi:hypothetical protein
VGRYAQAQRRGTVSPGETVASISAPTLEAACWSDIGGGNITVTADANVPFPPGAARVLITGRDTGGDDPKEVKSSVGTYNGTTPSFTEVCGFYQVKLQWLDASGLVPLGPESDWLSANVEC